MEPQKAFSLRGIRNAFDAFIVVDPIEVAGVASAPVHGVDELAATLVGFGHDLSEGGLSLDVDQSVRPASRCTCTFTLPDEVEPVVARSTVVWSSAQGDGVRLGIRFDDLSAEDHERVRRHLSRQRAFDGRARVRLEGLPHLLTTHVATASPHGATLLADLPFFRLGSRVAVVPPLEDGTYGDLRVGHITRIAVDESSRGEVPQIRIRVAYDQAADVDAVPVKSAPPPPVALPVRVALRSSSFKSLAMMGLGLVVGVATAGSAFLLRQARGRASSVPRAATTQSPETPATMPAGPVAAATSAARETNTPAAPVEPPASPGREWRTVTLSTTGAPRWLSSYVIDQPSMIVIDARGVGPGPVTGPIDPAIRGVRTMRRGTVARFLVLFHGAPPRYRLAGAPRGVRLTFEAPASARGASAATTQEARRASASQLIARAP